MTPYEHFLIKHRVYCEEPSCLKQGKVVREIDGHDKVLCFEHDPEQVQDFISWLEQQGDALPLPQDFETFLQRTGDAI